MKEFQFEIELLDGTTIVDTILAANRVEAYKKLIDQLGMQVHLMLDNVSYIAEIRG